MAEGMHPLLHAALISSRPAHPPTHRVPITVEDDDCVGCGQVDAQATRPRGEEEDGVLLGAGVKAVNAALALRA